MIFPLVWPQKSVVDGAFSVCRDVSLLLAFVSALLMLPSWWKESSWLLWGLVLFVYAVFRVWGTWRTARLQMSLRKYCIQLEETVANSRAFTNLVRKALRLIQETEVISRGFTLWVCISLYLIHRSIQARHLRQLSLYTIYDNKWNYRKTQYLKLFFHIK